MLRVDTLSAIGVLKHFKLALLRNCDPQFATNATFSAYTLNQYK